MQFCNSDGQYTFCQHIIHSVLQAEQCLYWVNQQLAMVRGLVLQHEAHWIPQPQPCDMYIPQPAKLEATTAATSSSVKSHSQLNIKKVPVRPSFSSQSSSFHSSSSSSAPSPSPKTSLLSSPPVSAPLLNPSSSPSSPHTLPQPVSKSQPSLPSPRIDKSQMGFREIYIPTKEIVVAKPSSPPSAPTPSRLEPVSSTVYTVKEEEKKEEDDKKKTEIKNLDVQKPRQKNHYNHNPPAFQAKKNRKQRARYIQKREKEQQQEAIPPVVESQLKMVTDRAQAFIVSHGKETPIRNLYNVLTCTSTIQRALSIMRTFAAKVKPPDVIDEFLRGVNVLAQTYQMGFLGGDDSMHWMGMWRDEHTDWLRVLDAPKQVKPLGEAQELCEFLMSEKVTGYPSVDYWVQMEQHDEWTYGHPKFFSKSTSHSFMPALPLAMSSPRKLCERTTDMLRGLGHTQLLINQFARACMDHKDIGRRDVCWIEVLVINTMLLDLYLRTLLTEESWKHILDHKEDWNKTCSISADKICGMCRYRKEMRPLTEQEGKYSDPHVVERDVSSKILKAIIDGKVMDFNCVRLWALDRLALCHEIHEHYGKLLHGCFVNQ